MSYHLSDDNEEIFSFIKMYIPNIDDISLTLKNYRLAASNLLIMCNIIFGYSNNDSCSVYIDQTHLYNIEVVLNNKSFICDLNKYSINNMIKSISRYFNINYDDLMFKYKLSTMIKYELIVLDV